MKLEYDKEVDAAYIYIDEEVKNKKATKTIELDDNIIIDFDNKGKLIGVEILDASKVLNKEVLHEARVSITNQ